MRTPQAALSTNAASCSTSGGNHHTPACSAISCRPSLDRALNREQQAVILRHGAAMLKHEAVTSLEFRATNYMLTSSYVKTSTTAYLCSSPGQSGMMNAL